MLPELEQYLQEPGIDMDADPLLWWKNRESKYPTLAHMARIFLSLPASSAPSERVFSMATDVLRPKRKKLLPDRVSRLMLLKFNRPVYGELTGQSQNTTIPIEEDIL
jgi:hypothetical protein